LSETDTGPTNRLAAESSPYLLQHRHNPVDWYPWGEEALERARREDRPIFLSVGYSTCYWCHVMARESFSDPRTAELMNRHFVNVKLDREERPDLDEIYMTATQVLADHGGWPNSVFLTPDLKPFYAGTYFPPADRQGLPGFPAVLASLAAAWRDRRVEVEEQAEAVADALRQYLAGGGPAGEPPGAALAELSLQQLGRRFDPLCGGFGWAPKFPTPANLLLLLEMSDERPEAGDMLASTLSAMGRGGIFDQLGGGFHRYATDREWRVPHFEKMLYDNGLLLELYAREHARGGDPEAARTARETALFLEREMTAPEGGLWSAIDAETGGHEGAFYVWTRQEIEAVLGAEDAAFLAPLLGFGGAPFFEGSRFVLHWPEPLAAQAERRRIRREELLAQVDPLRRALLAARSRRPRPATDDKVLTEWNGMAIGGLAVAGRLLGEPALVRRAARAADFVLGALRPAGGPLLHVWRGGSARIPAFLADYVHLVRGLLALHEAEGEPRWLRLASELAAEQAVRLADPRGGYFSAAESADVLVRSREVFDGAVPAPNPLAAQNALELFVRTGEERWLRDARATLAAFADQAARQVEGVRTLAVAARRYARLAAPAEVATKIGPPGELEREALAKVSLRLELAPPAGDGWQAFTLIAAIAPGWHLHARRSAEAGLIATELAADGAELAAVEEPAGEAWRSPAGDVLQVLRTEARWRGTVRAAHPAAALRLAFQACDERRCLPPATAAVRLRAVDHGPVAE